MTSSEAKIPAAGPRAPQAKSVRVRRRIAEKRCPGERSEHSVSRRAPKSFRAPRATNEAHSPVVGRKASVNPVYVRRNRPFPVGFHRARCETCGHRKTSWLLEYDENYGRRRYENRRHVFLEDAAGWWTHGHSLERSRYPMSYRLSARSRCKRWNRSTPSGRPSGSLIERQRVSMSMSATTMAGSISISSVNEDQFVLGAARLRHRKQGNSRGRSKCRSRQAS